VKYTVSGKLCQAFWKVVRTSGKWISARIGGGAFIPTAFREMGMPAPVVSSQLHR